MKKIFICVLFIFVLTGCNATYTIDISDGIVREKLGVFEKSVDIANIKDESNQSFFDYSKYYGEEKNILTSFYELYADDHCDETSSVECTFYDKKFLNEDGVGFELFHDFKIDEYYDSSIPNEFIPGFEVFYDGKYLNISGGTNWNFINGYNNLERINVVINTDYKVESTNMKHTNDGYTFSVHSGDTSTLNKIYIILDTEKEVEKSYSIITIVLIIMLIISIGLIITINLMKKNNRNNYL